MSLKGFQFDDGDLEPEADPEAISRLREYAGGKLPEDYLEFLSHHNGGDGEIGENYLVLYDADQTIENTEDYELAEHVPGLHMIAGIGGDSFIAYDLSDPKKPIVIVPFTPMERSEMVEIAKDFEGLLTRRTNYFD